MNKEEYFKTIYIKDTKVDIGVDDYGQQYFLEFEKDGEIQTIGCGAYQFDFIEQAVYYIDPEGWENNSYNFQEMYDEFYEKFDD